MIRIDYLNFILGECGLGCGLHAKGAKGLGVGRPGGGVNGPGVATGCFST